MPEPTTKIEVVEWLDDEGRSPYSDWVESLDNRVMAIIETRVMRIEQGLLGDVKSVGGGVMEARIPFGPGYRIYMGRDGRTLVILLGGGDKGSQKKYIKAARERWEVYVREKAEAKKKGRK